MKSAMTNQDRLPAKIAGRSIPAKTALLLATGLMLSGCLGERGALATSGLSSLNPFGSKNEAPTKVEIVVLARDPATITNGSEIEVAILNAMELAEQIRFTEARYLLADIRAYQPAGSDGYHGLTCAMALLALSEGDTGTFRRMAQQLDQSLEHPVRVPPTYTEVITLYRAMTGKDLPVNAPERMKPLRHMLSDVRGVQS